MSNDGGYGGGHGRPDDPYNYGDPQYPGDQSAQQPTGQSEPYPPQQYPTQQFGQQQYGQPQYGQQQYGQPQYGQQQQYGSDQYGSQQYGSQPYPTQQFPSGAPQHQGSNQKPILIGLGAVVLVGVIVIVLAVAGVFSGDSKSVADPTDSVSTGPTADFPSSSSSAPTSSVPTPSPSSSSLGSSSTGTGGSTLGALCPNTDPVRTVRLFVSGITLSSIDISAGCLGSGSDTSRSDVQTIIASGQKYSPTVETGQTGPTFTFTSVDGAHKLTVKLEKQSDGKYYVVSAEQS